MNILELLKTSIKALNSNKSRTALTMLGIVIGIASVISLLGVGNGTQASVQSRVSALGSNLLTITSGSQNTGVVNQGAGSSQTLTYNDAKAIRSDKSIQNLTAVSAELGKNAQIIATGTNENATVNGVEPDYAIVHNYQIDTGSFITEDNLTTLAKVAVIGPDTATTLFGSTSSAVGQTIKINRIIFKVVGVTVSKGSSGFGNQDDVVFVPLTVAQKILFGQDYLRTISIQGSDSNTLTTLQQDITTVLLNRHNISDPTAADFTIRNSADTLATLNSITGQFTLLLGSVAGISLIVGGIGIMNIMIVTVTERTKEIGLRKAIGAKNKVILAQFLTEAVVMTFIGGCIGILLGLGIGFLLSNFAGQTVLISPASIILASSVSVLIGITFGLYPALRASRLNPIEALRYE